MENKAQDMEKSDKNKEINGKTEVFQIRHGFWRTYDATDGLPGEPKHLLQDEKGYLWIGTNSGICRYDGLEFIRYTTEQGLPDNIINNLCLDNQGRIWISTPNGLSCFDGDGFTNYTIDNGLPGNNAGQLCLDNQGKLWIGTSNGLSCYDGEGFISYTTENGLLDNDIVGLCSSNNGGIWIGTKGGISRFDGQNITTLETDIIAFPQMLEDRRGQLWIGSGREGIHCFDGQQFRTYTYDDGFVDIQNLVLSIYEDRRGRMWFGAWAGVSCFDGDKFTSYQEGLWSGGIFDIIEDREGQMWFAHAQSCGLSCYDPETIGLLSDESAGWTSIQDRKGRIWCGAIGVRVFSPDSELSETEMRKIPFSGGGIYSMVDSRDRLWVSPFRDGVYCYDSPDSAWDIAGGDGSTKPHHFGVCDNLTDEYYTIPLLEMEDGTIWFSLHHLSQLTRFDPDQLPDGKPIESITKGFVSRLIKDSRGNLWMNGDGLSRWDGDELVTYTKEDGLPSNNVASLLEDDLGHIWIGTGHGLCCYDGQKFIAYGEKYGLSDLFHWQSAKDSSGQLWFAARGGFIEPMESIFSGLRRMTVFPATTLLLRYPSRMAQ